MHLCVRGTTVDCTISHPQWLPRVPRGTGGAHVLQSNKLVIPPSAIKVLRSKWALYPALLHSHPSHLPSFSCLIPKFYIIPPATASIISHPTEHGAGVKGPFALIRAQSCGIFEEPGFGPVHQIGNIYCSSLLSSSPYFLLSSHKEVSITSVLHSHAYSESLHIMLHPTLKR